MITKIEFEGPVGGPFPRDFRIIREYAELTFDRIPMTSIEILAGRGVQAGFKGITWEGCLHWLDWKFPEIFESFASQMDFNLLKNMESLPGQFELKLEGAFLLSSDSQPWIKKNREMLFWALQNTNERLLRNFQKARAFPGSEETNE